MSHGEDHVRSFRRAALLDGLLWIVLMILVGLALATAKLTSFHFGFVIELGIAVVQVALLALFFMQLRSARPLILLTAASATIFLMSMFALTLNDLFTRV